MRYPLSVIIPIHKSSLNIERCIDSLLANDRLNLQIIVAANSDSREEIQKINRKIRLNYRQYRCISIIDIHKSGKPNAINQALRYVRNEVVMIGDADTYFYRRGLTKCVSLMYKYKNLVAVTGRVEVYQKNALSCLQNFEYRRIFHIFRPLWDQLCGNIMISGCAGIFRTDCLFEVGLYDTHTIGEDYEITLRLHDYYIRHNIDYEIKYVNIPLAKTDVPTNIKALIKQRGRWFRGFVEVTAKYRNILIHPIAYRRIFFPLVLALIFEKWTSMLKWLLLGISVVICVNNGRPLISIIMISAVCMGLFEIIFNSVMMNRIIFSTGKGQKVVSIIVLTLCLMVMQFILKDTNVVNALFINRSKKNKW
ncbi:MAG: glycosyltransferase family 2 protein [Lachnospiraceae bacterium]|nr:glycosyltransferase family 2 protein [Candidatus Darwinimomas equi]